MTEEFKIVRAERTQARLRLALQGPSGAGKTATSLLLGKGMVSALQARGKLPAHLDGVYIGLLDTERDSAKLYSHLVPFDTLVLEPPYSPSRYLAALRALERVGYPIIIADQITHEWYGQGGVLDMVKNSKEANDFAKWNGPSQEHDAFMDGLLQSPAHLIVTMRSKTAWALEDKVGRDGKTRKVPVRIGMQAKQRDGTEFEFTTVLDLAVPSNEVTCLKDRTELFVVGEHYGRMGPAWGEKLIDWVYSAKAIEASPPEPSPAMRALAVCEAGIRTMERCVNVPDLAIAFQDAQKAVKAHNVSAGADVVVPLLERLVAAKDQRKTALSAVPENPAPAPAGELISADDVANLEMLCSDAQFPISELRTHMGVARLSQLELSRFDEAQDWIISHGSDPGAQKVKHVPARQAEPSPKEVMNNIVTRIGNSRGGFFDDMQDDTQGVV